MTSPADADSTLDERLPKKIVGRNRENILAPAREKLIYLHRDQNAGLPSKLILSSLNSIVIFWAPKSPSAGCGSCSLNDFSPSAKAVRGNVRSNSSFPSGSAKYVRGETLVPFDEIRYTSAGTVSRGKLFQDFDRSAPSESLFA